MKRSIFTILITALLLTGLMVSCNSDVSVEQPISGELVAISFDNGGSKGLTASLEAFNKNDYYWAYAAKKADNSNLVSGQTSNYGQSNEQRVWVKVDENNNPVQGLGSGTGVDYKPYKVPGFSQGTWDFKLFAFKGVLGDNPNTTEVETNYVLGYKLVYEGEAKNVVLKSESVNNPGSHSVNVIVNPTKTEYNGTLLIDTTSDNKITLNTVSTSAVYGTHYTIKVLSVESIVPDGATPTEYVGSSAETQVASSSQNGLFSLPAGSYKVTVSFTDSGNTVNYARGSVVATVYSNLETTIGGDLTEAITYAEFESDINPELVTVTVSSEDIPVYNVEQETEKTVKIVTDTSAAKAVTAEIKKADTNTLITTLAEKLETNTAEYDQSLKLTLKVETVEVEENTATYEIGMSAKLTSTKTEGQTVVETKETTSDVTEVADYVTVTVQLQSGLTEVTVYHSGNKMAGGIDFNIDEVIDTGHGKFSYNSASGVLTIQTKSFSPFKVTYTAPAETAYVAKIGNYKYTSLKNAVDNAKTNDSIILLSDYSLAEGEALSKDNVALDLAGHTLTVPSGKTLTLSGNGAAVITGSIVLAGENSLVMSGNNSVISDVALSGGTISVSGTGVEIEDCVINSGSSVAINVTETGSATIDGGTYTATHGILSNGNITVVDGIFEGTIVSGTGEGITLTGGTYNEALPEGNQITIPVGYEYKMVSDGVYNVIKKVVARNITEGIDYYRFKDAINATVGNSIIELYEDVETGSEYTITNPLVLKAENVTLNLNGHTVTVTNNFSFVIEADSVEVKNGYIVSGPNSEKRTNKNSYVLVVNNCDGVKLSELTMAGGVSVGGSQDDWGTVENRKAGVSGVSGAGTATNVVIEGCTIISGDYYAVCSQMNSDVTIKSGTYTSDTTTVNPGKGSAATGVLHGYFTSTDGPEGKVFVQGGTVNGTINSSNVGWVVLTGGDYDHDPNQFAAEGYYGHKNSENSWTVKVIPEGSKVKGNGRYYTTLTEAVNDSSEGDILTLIDDITESVSIKKSNLTIDLDGNKLTASDSKYAVKLSECENVTIKNGKIESAGRVFVIGDHHSAIVKWKMDGTSMWGYHPLSPAKNILLKDITAVATGTDSMFYYTNIEDDLGRADKSNPTDNDLYGRYIYNGGYATEDLFTPSKQYSTVFIECTDKDSVSIIGGSYTASAMFGHMCKYTTMGVYDGEIYSEVLNPVSGSFSTDEVGRFLGEGKYLIGTDSNTFVVSDTSASSYKGKVNKNYYCYDGGANDAIKYANFGETVYIREDSNQEKVFLTNDKLFVVYEEKEISYSGATTEDRLYTLKCRLVENTENTYEFYTDFDPVAAVYITTNNTVQPALTEENLVGEYASVAEAFAAANNNQFRMVILLRDYEGGDDSIYYYTDKARNAGAHSGSSVRFDLNGHVWTYTGTNYALVITTTSGSSNKDTVILDSKGGGMIYAPNGICIYKENSSTENSRIKSGTFIAKNQPIYFNKISASGKSGKFYIEGGTFESLNSNCVYLGWTHSSGELIISGGSFKSKDGTIKDIANGLMGAVIKCTISGGTYYSDPSTFDSNVTVTKGITDNGDGTWTVK